MLERSLGFHILIALAARQNHGYGIFKQLIQDSGGRIIYERSVYRELPRLIQAGLIEPVHPTMKPTQYQLTHRGRKRLRIEQGELRKLEQLLRERRFFKLKRNKLYN